MRKSLFHIIVSSFFLLLFFLNAGAQTNFKSQDELKEKADEYFLSEDYESAMPLYSQLVSLYPKDPVYNYRFGVCLIFADRRDNEKPIKYLELASIKTGVDDEVFYYLGLAYHQNYRFDDAIKEYEKYKELANSKKVTKLDVTRQIEICNNAKSLLTHISDLFVLQKTEVVTKDFFRSYDIERFGGKILVKPEDLKTPYDKKKEKFSLCFFSTESNEVFFSSYGKDGKNGKDIYRCSKNDDGTWSKPENLGPTINTPYDEDFPFLLPDGATLYYSSKGGNTIGGYDIFTSTLKSDGTWDSPENLNYPINTPFDDIMFVPDSSGKYAYFSSERTSMESMITVYRVRIDTRPKIEEQLVLDKPDGAVGNDSAYKQTLQFLKEKSSLDVNATESMFAEKDNIVANNVDNEKATDNKDSYSDTDISDNMSNQDIVNLAEEQALLSQKELKELQTKRDAAVKIAANRKTQAEEKYKEAASIVSNAENISDNNERKTQLSKATTMQSEAEQLKKESVIAEAIATKLEKQVVQKQTETKEAIQYSQDIRKAVQSNSIDSSIAMLERMTEKLQNTDLDEADLSANSNNEYIEQKAKEAENLYIQSKALQEEITSLNNQVEKYKNQAEATKKKTQKEEYLQNASNLEEEIKIKQSELDDILQKTEKVQYEGDSARTQSSLYASVVEDIQNNNTSAKTTTATNTVIASNTLANNTSNNSISTTTETKNDNQTKSSNLSDDVIFKDNSNSKQENTTNDLASGNSNNKNTTNNNSRNKTEISVSSNTSNISSSSSDDNESSQTNASSSVSSSTTQVDSKNDEKVASQAEIINQSDNILSMVTASIESIKKEADNAYVIAFENNVQSQKKQKEADNLKAEATEIANMDEQEKYLKEADVLSNEALELARKAVVAFSMAEYLNEEYNIKKEQVSDLKEMVQKVKESASEGNTSDAQEILNEVKAEQATIIAFKTKTQYLAEQSNILDSKQYELQQAQETADDLQQVVDSLSGRSRELRKQANDAKKTSQQKELVKQAEQVEEQLAQVKKQADEAYDMVDDYESEVNAMKMKISYSSAIVSETATYTKPASSNIDKTALENSITLYENKDVFAENTNSSEKTTVVNIENNDMKEVAATNANNNSQAVSSDNTASNNSTSNTTSLAPLKDQEISDVTTITNPQQIEAKADVIDQAIVTIRTRIKIKQSELKEVTDEQGKTDINKEILQLQNELSVLQEQSDETHAEAKNGIFSNEIKDNNTDYNALAENLQNEAANDLDNATEKRKEANTATDPVEKENLRNEAADLEKMAESKTLESFEIKDIGNTSEFYSNSSLIDSVSKLVGDNPQITTARLLENESEYYFDKAKALEKTIDSDMTYAEKKSVYNDVLTNEKSAIEKQQKAIDIYKELVPTYSDNSSLKNTAGINSTSSTAVTNNQNPNNPTLTDSNIKTDNNSSSSNSTNIISSNSDNYVSTDENAITTSEFKGVYINTDNNISLNLDANNLIPLNPSLPSGIVFKVQFCAVNRHVSPDVFPGITPITGESTTFGIYRYLAGLFANYEDALSARNLIRPMGYADAFVVAYNNGKRITIGEALALLKSDNTLETTYASLNNKSYISTGNSNTGIADTKNIVTNEIAALSNPVSEIGGLFYSVQVGVYVKPVTSAQLFNITPLYDEIMTNGYYRYLSGSYSNVQDAIAAKNAIITKGVTDAFVVVYYNGKKISFAEAKVLQESNTKAEITMNNNSDKTERNMSSGDLKTEINSVNNAAAGISFKVQVGAYKKEVPIDVINQWLDVAVSNGLEHYVNNNGLTIYTSGNFKDYNSANEYKNTLVAKGLVDAYIVAFQGEEKIAVTKAIELIK